VSEKMPGTNEFYAGLTPLFHRAQIMDRLAIVGSPRKGRATDVLVDMAIKGACLRCPAAPCRVPASRAKRSSS
jgi:hypothetical protein